MNWFAVAIVSVLFNSGAFGFYLPHYQRQSSQMCQCHCLNGQSFAMSSSLGMPSCTLPMYGQAMFPQTATVVPVIVPASTGQVTSGAHGEGITFPARTQGQYPNGQITHPGQTVTDSGQSVQQPDYGYPSAPDSTVTDWTSQYPDYSGSSGGDSWGTTESDWGSQDTDQGYPSEPDWTSQYPDYSSSSTQDTSGSSAPHWADDIPDYSDPSTSDYSGSSESDWTNQYTDYSYPSSGDSSGSTGPDWSSQYPDSSYPSTPDQSMPTEPDWSSQTSDSSYPATGGKSQTGPTSGGNAFLIGTTPSLTIVAYPTGSVTAGVSSASMFPTRMPISPCAPQNTDVEKLLTLLSKSQLQQALPNGCEIYKVAPSTSASGTLQVSVKLSANRCKEIDLTSNTSGSQGSWDSTDWSVDRANSVSCPNRQAMEIPPCGSRIF